VITALTPPPKPAHRNQDEMRSWLAANGCPERTAAHIVEKRTQAVGFTPKQQALPAAQRPSVIDKVRAGGIL